MLQLRTLQFLKAVVVEGGWLRRVHGAEGGGGGEWYSLRYFSFGRWGCGGGAAVVSGQVGGTRMKYSQRVLSCAGGWGAGGGARQGRRGCQGNAAP